MYLDELLRVTDIVYTQISVAIYVNYNKCGDIRQFSLIDNGLDGNQGTFGPRFIVYGMGKSLYK